MAKKLALHNFTFLVVLLMVFNCVNAQTQIKVVIAGLNHNHVNGILNQYNKGKVIILGIAEPDKSLHIKYGKIYKLPDSLFYTDLKKLISERKPEAVLGYNATAAHVNIVEICAPLGIPVMVEKPLAATLSQAKRIEFLANKYKVHVLTNYETTWYASYHQVNEIINQDSIGTIKKMVVHDGHQGPKEIGCSPEFLRWLTDPVQNGAGALFDFGCYGANLMTWLMKGKKPLAVTAITRTYKPNFYPNVDDDATIIVEYAGATGVIQASWNWPFGIKDLEVFGQKGYLHALDNSAIHSRMRGNKIANRIAKPLGEGYNNNISYLSAVLKGQISGKDDLSSLNYNMIVMEILDAAKRSAAKGKRIVL